MCQKCVASVKNIFGVFCQVTKRIVLQYRSVYNNAVNNYSIALTVGHAYELRRV